MVELDIQIPSTFDPFAEAKESDPEEYVHIRLHQIKGKKLTTVEGLKKEELEKILKDLKSKLGCGGNIVEGKIIQLEGDHRKDVAQILVNDGFVSKDHIIIHGY